MNEQPFDVEFSLTVVVKGRSLQDIDNGLVQAAGQRLAARMVNPPSFNGNSIVGGGAIAPTHPANAAPAALETVLREEPRAAAGGEITNGVAEPGAANEPHKGKRGVKPGSTRGPYKKPGEAEAPAADPAPVAETPPPAAPPAAPIAPTAPVGTGVAGKIPDLQAAVAALTVVNTKKNSDIAFACLTHFSVKRCSELTDANRQQFIDHCHAEAAK
jgi:hypothetical protein